MPNCLAILTVEVSASAAVENVEMVRRVNKPANCRRIILSSKVMPAASRRLYSSLSPFDHDAGRRLDHFDDDGVVAVRSESVGGFFPRRRNGFRHFEIEAHAVDLLKAQLHVLEHQAGCKAMIECAVENGPRKFILRRVVAPARGVN